MSSGILYGLSAYVLWGMFPLFFKQLQAASAIEVVLHRMVWSLVFVLIVLAVLRRWNWLGDGETSADAIRRADKSMYLAKRSGKNRVMAA